MTLIRVSLCSSRKNKRKIEKIRIKHEAKDKEEGWKRIDEVYYPVVFYSHSPVLSSFPVAGRFALKRERQRYETHLRVHPRVSPWIHVNKGVHGGKEATKVAYERDPANPRGRPSAYQSDANLGYPLEYDQQLELPVPSTQS